MITAILLVLALQEVGRDGVMSIESSYIGGERLDFAITQGDLEAAPKWVEALDDPPLAPRQAVRTARRQLAEFVPNADRWRVMAVTLRQVMREDVSIYVVEFNEPLPDPPPGVSVAGSFMAKTIRIPVLMNGATVAPTRTPWPLPR
jgi:hypothetical protein